MTGENYLEVMKRDACRSRSTAQLSSFSMLLLETFCHKLPRGFSRLIANKPADASAGSLPGIHIEFDYRGLFGLRVLAQSFWNTKFRLKIDGIHLA